MYGQLIVNGLVHPVQHCSHIVREEWGSCFVFPWSFRWSVVPVLVLLIVALLFFLRGDLFYFLPCVILFLCFFSPFSIAITSLGEERANLSAFPTFVWFALVWFCLFPLPLGVWELRFVIVALPGRFSYPFFFWCFSNVCSICACLILSVSSSSWCLGRAAVCDCGTPLTFLLPFLVLFIRLFDLRLFGFVCFLSLLVSWKGCGLFLWHSLDFSLTLFGAFRTFVWFTLVWFCLLPLGVWEGLRFVIVAFSGLLPPFFVQCLSRFVGSSIWCRY